VKIRVCYGTVDVSEYWKCPRCDGTGRAETYFRSGMFGVCPYCSGTGSAARQSNYTYTSRASVEVGDLVMTPGNWHRKDPQTATVVAIGSDYDGHCSEILRVLERTEETLEPEDRGTE
jgi:Ribonuclease G/E